MKPIIAVPATLALLYRSYSKKSLTPAGIVAALLTAVAHAVHPWNLPFVLLGVFFLAGTRATHVKEKVKAKLTLPADGPSTGGGGEGPRTHTQVFANSFVASVLSLMHAYQLHQRKKAIVGLRDAGSPADAALGALCYAWGGDLLVIGIIANYACVAADTFSSELGILSGETPRLITSLRLRKVPRGTNGGVTLGGLAAGLLGSTVVVTTAVLFLPACAADMHPILFGGMAATTATRDAAVWTIGERRLLMLGLAVWGLLGSVLDSVLGGLLQRSVRDVRSGKIVEGSGGLRVLVEEQPHVHLHGPLVDPDSPAAAVSEDEADPTDEAMDAKKAAAVPIPDRYDVHIKHRRPSFGNYRPSRVVENGWDLLDNNDVNFLMACTMSVGAMYVAGWYWGVPMQSVLRP
ncbi:duf92 domain containing protein [Grosmannia clavigera kw1407]|uniref:Duf92 domain containing protein n=1 Tax=Grosmannia clavigera (strain kw1407 / UAMH 11150) TaxID=655863 RepID=F0XGR1_GROCL|nr:duf92 domain containing protein [Grosmannia clavigera kw1407]EFX02740.1 duf92 domain containing protein [Grosmannia clavigera kw1407]